MNKRNLLILAFCITATSARAQPPQQQVSCSIDVSLVDSTHSLDGFVRIRYQNNSRDTLSYIWIRCWPNAFKDDRTAFSEQLIRNRRTDFYFSDKSQKGYLNRLEFRVDGQLARIEDHPQYIDVIGVILPTALPPGGHATLTTPFHVQLPDNFSHFGYHQGIYEIANWYPSPAVFDSLGWHPQPYLDQGGAYNEFCDFDVRITVPANFVVAATGQPETADSSKPATITVTQTSHTKTLHYRQNNIPEFSWFASRRFRTDADTLRLPSGRIISLYSIHLANAPRCWKSALSFLKAAILFNDAAIGEYPYNSATVVETLPDAGQPLQSTGAGIAHPAIVGIDGRDSLAVDFDLSIEKAVCDNWLSIIIGADGRRYPWMTKGIGTYYYDRYRLTKYGPGFYQYFAPDTFHRAAVNTDVVLHEDQPVSTSAEAFTPDNYRLIAGYKTAIWMKELERRLGCSLFDSCMHRYFRRWQFRHANPEALKAAFVSTTDLNVDSAFALLDTTGPVSPFPYHRPLALNPQFIPHPTYHNNLNISPAIGFNDYDHLMVGAMVHNFNLPPDNWQILATALYGTVSHQWNGLFHFNRAWYPGQTFRVIEAGLNGSRFSTTSGTDSNGRAIFGGFYKAVPYLRVTFARPSVGSTRESRLEWKTFLIGESTFDNYVLKSTDSLYYPTPGKYKFRYLDQLSLTIRDTRVLYPYSILLQAQQAASFYRVNLDIGYFFNYDRGGGLDARLFGAKFGYLGFRDPAVDLTPFEPKLTALRGTEDYTYQDYFIGRNQYSGLASQQILERDGDLPLRTDLFQGLQGRSDNWVGAVNLSSTLPATIVPKWIPLKVFFDLGTYAQAWQDNPPTGHFLYVGGFELCLLGDLLRIYAPLVYSSDFSTQLKSVPGQNGFFQKISFSLNVRRIQFRKWLGYTPF